MLGLIFAGQGAQGKDVSADTRTLQPKLVRRELALSDALKQRGIVYGVTAGFSLGEWPALAACGVLTPETVYALVEKRAAFMADAAEAMAETSPGGMAAVLGLTAEDAEALCAEAGVGEAWVSPANYNAPGQTVVSGNREGLAALQALVKQRGGRMLPLRVSGAFHSRAMQPAAQRLRLELEQTTFTTPGIAWVPNLTASPIAPGTGAPFAELLSRQCAEPVRWEASVRAMLSLGVTAFLEMGPGAVLTGLIARIAPETPCACAADEAELDEALDKISLS